VAVSVTQYVPMSSACGTAAFGASVIVAGRLVSPAGATTRATVHRVLFTNTPAVGSSAGMLIVIAAGARCALAAASAAAAARSRSCLRASRRSPTTAPARPPAMGAQRRLTEDVADDVARARAETCAGERAGLAIGEAAARAGGDERQEHEGKDPDLAEHGWLAFARRRRSLAALGVLPCVTP
jgi:hypothetical protein